MTAGNQSVLVTGVVGSLTGSFSKPLGAGCFISEKMDLFADKESTSKTKERVSTKTFKRKRKRQNQSTE
jgi:hypothetical protein